MLLRGVNAVGYTSYADNLVKEFVKESVAAGIDIFRVRHSPYGLDRKVAQTGTDLVHRAFIAPSPGTP